MLLIEIGLGPASPLAWLTSAYIQLPARLSCRSNR